MCTAPPRVADLDKNIVAIRYNVLNLPDTIQFKNGNQVINTYNADGQKLRTKYYTSMTDVNLPVGKIHGAYSTSNATLRLDDYFGSILYENGTDETPTNHPLTKILTTEGYVDYVTSGKPYCYYNRDHLGSIHEVSSYIGQSGTVVQRTQYYPSGTPFEQSYGAGVQPYKFTGKELITMHGLNWQDFGARWLDNVRMQWTTMDPLCEKYYAISPYTYCSDDPAKNIDPDGRDWVDHGGKIIWINNVTSATDKDLQKGDKYLGKNVLVGTDNRDANLHEPINSARFDLYLESNKKGSTATIYGNTVPADVKKYGTLKEGIYPASESHRSKYPNEKAILINGGKDVPTVNGNPHDPKGKPVAEQTLTGIFFHKGNAGRESLTTSRGEPISEGCQTGPNKAGSQKLFDDFMDHVPADFNGYYYLRPNY